VTIARTLEDEIKFKKIKDDHPALWQHINRVLDKYKSDKTKSKFINRTIKYHELVIPQWNRKDATAVGLTCIELMRQATGIIDVQTRTDAKGKSYTMIRPTESLLKWLKDSHEYREYMSPVWLPMVERPVDWTNPYLGGYQGTCFGRRALVKTMDKSYLEDISHCNMQPVYSAVNALQRTGYRINSRVAAVFKGCWDDNLAIGGVPSLENDPIPNKPEDISTNAESRRAWRKAAARQHFENERKKSKRLQVMKVLNLVDKFKHSTLYYPFSMCFRGRGYPVPYFLQPQGPSWVKAMLKFSRGKPITDRGLFWLYVKAANAYGHDKLSFDARSDWTESNLSWIRAVGGDPERNMEWVKADEPWEFLSACIEIHDLHATGSSFVTTLPVGVDATTQGLQILALMLRDPVAAVATNVISGDKPNDPYESVADLVIQKLQQDLSSPYAQKWIDFGINRKTTKRQTMTLVYGSVFYSCRSYTAEWFYDQLKDPTKVNPFGDETYAPCNYLAGKIWESIGEVVSSARIVMDWLRSVAAVFSDNQITPRWVTPLGFPVKMHYENMQAHSIKTVVGGTIRQHRINVPSGNQSKRKTVNGICANLVHSYDGLGGLLGLTVNKCLDEGVHSFMTVHDNISSTASDMDTINKCVREATVDIFSENVLQTLHNQFSVLLPGHIDLPQAPAVGTLDVSRVLESKYYFS
jgi:DNA-directed RNA polymerase